MKNCGCGRRVALAAGASALVSLFLPAEKAQAKARFDGETIIVEPPPESDPCQEAYDAEMIFVNAMPEGEDKYIAMAEAVAALAECRMAQILASLEHAFSVGMDWLASHGDAVAGTLLVVGVVTLIVVVVAAFPVSLVTLALVP